MTETRDLIVVGASAGGVDALQSLVGGLPPGLPASVVIVLHLPPGSPSALTAILRRRCALPVTTASDGQTVEWGRVYVAPPDRHLIAAGNKLGLSNGPRENGHRPSVDVLFRSAAASAGRRVIGVVLSGALDDGSAGLAAIKQMGGLAVVQDPSDALVVSMPESALRFVEVDHVIAAAQMGKLFDVLTRDPLPPQCERPELGGAEEASLGERQVLAQEIALAEVSERVSSESLGVPSGFGCPECGGALFELHEGSRVYYRCRVGHSWTQGSLLGEQGQAVESALWTALRALEERSALLGKMARSASRRGQGLAAERLTSSAREAREAAGVIRGLLEDLPSHVPATDGEALSGELA